MKKLSSILAYFFQCWRGFALKGLLWLCCFFCGANLGFAQQYPVVGSFFITPPYPANWADYANPNLDKLRLQLTLTDITVAQRRVKLRLTIKYQNKILAQSVDNPQSLPILFLDGGVPSFLTGAELAAYFLPENLVGMSSVLFSQTLPEGLYSFGFEVLDFYTGNKLSTDISQNIWILLNDPPLLNMPLNGEVIKTFNPISPQIIFQWTPRSTQASQTEYIFTLTELWDEGSNPAQEFLSAIPLYQTTTFQTILLYGIAEPPLQLGKKYAWRVQARAKAGFEQIGLFRQDGFSAINIFQYGGGCEAPIGFTAKIEDGGGLGLRWQPSMQLGATYTIAIRRTEKKKPDEWMTILREEPEFVIKNVEPGTEYAVKVGLNCPNGLVSYGQETLITTPKEEVYNNPNCGVAPKIDLSNRTLIESLKVGDVVMGNDFPITLLSVSGDKNGWSGEAWMEWTWGAKLKIKVKYANIQINTDKRLIKGFFETTYEPKAGNIVDVDKTIEDVKGIIDEIKKMLQSYDGSEKSRAAAAQGHEDINKQYAALVESPYLSAAEKEQMTALHKETEHCWKALAEGKTCDSASTNPTTTPPSSGPNLDFSLFFEAGKPNYDCFTKQAEKESDQIKALAEKAAAAEKATKNTAITCVCKDSVGENKAFAKLLSAYTSSTCTEVLEQLQKIKTGGAGGAALRFNVFGAATRPVEVSALETQCLQIGSEKITGILLGGIVKEMDLIDGSDANGLTEKEIYGVQVNKDKLQGYNEYATKEQRGLVQYKPNNLADYMILLSEKDEDQYNRQLKALKEYLGIGEAKDTAKKVGTYTISLEKMQEIFPVKGQQLEHLKAVLPYLNAYMADWGITDNNRLAYLLSQIGPETGNFRNFDEKDDGKYSKNGMITTFGKRLDKCKNSIEEMVKDPDNPEELFNCVYCCVDENGNEASGDGFRYRGRGLIQLTHKESYRKFTLWYNKNYADDPQNFVENPDLLNQPKYATLSALWEFCVDKNGGNEIFNYIKNGKINLVTQEINGKYALEETLLSRRKALQKAQVSLQKN